ncbi:transcription factor E2F8 isoform X2 [Paramormyrops kingsleyae]|uniref:transcription factor E2F8 isoform X2 n=1 Tax=Paramormyrops kingsleyae TaxID=1676925 RepID=UPI003B973BE8
MNVLLDLQNSKKSKINSSCGLTSVDEKDNAFLEPDVLMKIPGNISSVDFQETMGSLTTPTKGKNNPVTEPWTPTSNLKMLISAASPEIRNREKELGLDNSVITEPIDASQEPSFDESEKLQISRKEKSLGLLCHKFLARYPDYPNPALNNDICLDDVAVELNVERRRIYDIMNVLESLHMVGRLAKNRYMWHGRVNLPQTLATLRKVGEEYKYGEQMEQIKQRSYEREFDFDGDEKENEDMSKPGDTESELGQKEMYFVELPGVEFRAASVNSRKDKSLRVMSQKFVMLFLVATPRIVSLEVAAKILIGEDQVIDLDKSKFKTKIRRLYDIANVLSSLELIKKVHVTEDRGRKPAFKWTGPEDFASTNGTLESRCSVQNCAKNLFPSNTVKHSFTRHPSLIKLAKSIQDDRRKINSAPSSPAKITEFVPSKMAQLAAICKIQLDEQSKKSKINPKVAPAVVNSLEQAEIGRKNNEPALNIEQNTNRTPEIQLPASTSGTMPFTPSQQPALIHVLLPQHQISRPYTLYVHPSVRPHPSSLAVRSMTFEDKTGGSSGKATEESTSPGKSATKDISLSQMQEHSLLQNNSACSPSSPASMKRISCDQISEKSPSKVMKMPNSSRSPSPYGPELGDIIQARLKARRSLVSNRPSPRALHLDPEFINTPENTAAEKLDQSVERFLEKEEKLSPCISEGGVTPLRAIPLQEVLLSSGHLPAEALIPTGYLIPISQPSLTNLQDSRMPGAESANAAASNHTVFHTPTAGSLPAGAQEFTPNSFSLKLASSAVPVSPFSVLSQPGPSPVPSQRLHSPSPAILNFTLQNMGLIRSGSPGRPSASAPSEQMNGSPAQLGFQQRGMIFVKPMSPVPLQQQTGQPLALFNLQQPLIATPKGTQPIHHSFFHTPVSTLSPLATVVTSSSNTGSRNVYIPQRKLDIATEDNCRGGPENLMLLNDFC